MAPKRYSSGSAPATGQRAISSFFAAKPAAGKVGKENTSSAGKAPAAAGAARRSPAVATRDAAVNEASARKGSDAPASARQTRSASASPAAAAKPKPAVKAATPKLGSAKRSATKVAGVKRSPAGPADGGVADAPSAPAAGVPAEDLEGRRVRVWWPAEREWYEGTVCGRTGRKHSVRYDDGDAELVDLSKEKFELLKGGKSRSVNDVQLYKAIRLLRT